MTNLKFKYLIENITINFWFSENFASMDEKKKKKKSNDRFVKNHI